MRTLHTLHTDNAPAAIGPYSQAIRVGRWLFCSGQIPLDPATGDVVSGDVAAQTERVFQNIRAILDEAGGSLERVVKTTVFLADMGSFGAMNEVYARHFGDHRPARSTIAVRTLPKNVDVEIEVIARL
ncbi:MAG: RidA family protein [Gemmatimonadota bacterium]